MAGVKLHEKVILNTDVKIDQEHFKIVHLSCPIPDRTKFLLEDKTKREQNPGEAMFQYARGLSALAEAGNTWAVAGVPCNTFHAPEIFGRLTELVEEMNSNLRSKYGHKGAEHFPGQVVLVNMIQQTADYLKAQGIKKIGLMSTTGTRKTRVYRDVLEPNGATIYEVNDEPSKTFTHGTTPFQAGQAHLHECIYNTDWGIKARSSATKEVFNAYSHYVHKLKDQGADAVILGCTEIPLVFPNMTELDGVSLVDPMDILVRSMIRILDATKLKPNRS